MNVFFKKTMISTIIVATGLLSGFSSAYAGQYTINLDRVTAYDDGDVGTWFDSPEGETSYHISVNGRLIYEKYCKMNDKGNDTCNIGESYPLFIGDGESASIRIRGRERDTVTSDDYCEGVIEVINDQNANRTFELDCRGSELGLKLYFYIARSN